MSYSNITKQAFANSLKELTQEMPFDKISVTMICERSGINRKNFYYHFRDKYDLVVWIFDKDFVAIATKQPFEMWSFLDSLCTYLYENRDFYRNVLEFQGQNSFSEHFEEFLTPLIKSQLQITFDSKELHSLCISFITDGLVCSIKRWLLDTNSVTADEFTGILKSLIKNIAVSYSHKNPDF